MNLIEYAAATGTKPLQFQRKLQELGVDFSVETVRRWFHGTLQPASKHMAVIEAATDGMVSRYHQRPEVFGEPPKEGEAA